MSRDPECVFCQRIDTDQVIAENDRVVAFPDGYPVSPGHTLIVPRRHEANYFALESGERRAMWSLVDKVREELQRRHGPAGYNIGMNVGTSAGQTVPHAHLHVIPRYPGDVEDPRGGVRYVIPDEAAYWDDDGDDSTP